MVLGTSSSLSFGVSAEYSDINLDMNAIRVESDDPFSDPLLANFPGATQFDFTFGTTLKVNGLTIGGSANRLSNFLGLG
ncbi:type IX secretion system membrane protein PorP/SprF, partial [Limnospira sp. PMC 917.15]|uniref:type IX secretion system membrane protein PorP/SprF n=1 Tax=Limnospira sp. PMC 917.15 TaxID=2981106 RepID=UPI0037C02DE3